MGNSLYFLKEDEGVGSAPSTSSLWRTTNGTAGAVKVDLPGLNEDDIRRMHSSSGHLFLEVPASGSNQLWSTDGTSATQLTSFPAGWGVSSYYDSAYTAVVGGTLFFSAGEPAQGTELWKSDGTVAGTAQVTDISPGTLNAYPRDLTVVGSAVYFSAHDSVHGRELWRSDGTAAGTTQVADLWPGSNGSSPRHLTAAGSRLFFTANDGLGGKLFTAEGTAVSSGFDPLPETFADISSITAMGNNVVFSGGTIEAAGLWFSDGTAAGTRGLTSSDVRRVGEVAELPGGAGVVFRAGTKASGSELWRSDGTAAGTGQVADLRPGVRGSFPAQFTRVGASVYFTAADGTHGEELWQTDGTSAGTVLAADIWPEAYSSAPYDLHEVAGLLYFTGDVQATGRELMRTSPLPPPPPPPAADTTVSGFKVSASKKQKQGKKIAIKAKVGAAEAVSSVLAAKISVKGVKKPIKLKSLTVSTTAGQTLAVKLKPSKKASKAIAKAIAKYRKATKKQQKKLQVKATLTVTATDAAGNTTTSKVKVILV